MNSTIISEKKDLAATYSPTDELQYHRRMGVLLPCSGWERVFPPSHGHQGTTDRGSRVVRFGLCRDRNDDMAKPHGKLVAVG